MNDERLQALEQVKQFLGGSEELESRVQFEGERYKWIERVLIRFSYHRLKRTEKGVIRKYPPSVRRVT